MATLRRVVASLKKLGQSDREKAEGKSPSFPPLLKGDEGGFEKWAYGRDSSLPSEQEQENCANSFSQDLRCFFALRVRMNSHAQYPIKQE